MRLRCLFLIHLLLLLLFRLKVCVFLLLGSTEEEDKRLGFVAPVLFFILALQTGLSTLDPEERLVIMENIFPTSW